VEFFVIKKSTWNNQSMKPILSVKLCTLTHQNVRLTFAIHFILENLAILTHRCIIFCVPSIPNCDNCNKNNVLAFPNNYVCFQVLNSTFLIGSTWGRHVFSKGDNSYSVLG
jgi:hypothetical protein